MSNHKKMVVIIQSVPQDYDEQALLYAVRTTIERAMAWCRVLSRFQVVAANPAWSYLSLKVDEWDAWIIEATCSSDLSELAQSEALKNEDTKTVLRAMRLDAAQAVSFAFQKRYDYLERYVVKLHWFQARRAAINNVRYAIARVRRIDGILKTAG